MPFHDGYMHTIPGRQGCPVLHDLPSPQNVRFLDGENVIRDGQYQLERWSDCVSFVYCDIPVNDFLKHLSIRNEPASGRDESLQQQLSLSLARVRRADEVHRNVGVDKDQTW